jgi:hypothetical protein
MKKQTYITRSISKFRLINDRIEYLQNKGIEVKNIAAGSGGVGTERTYKGRPCIQISYGVSKWNYAYIAFLD